MTSEQRILFLHVGLPKTGTSALQVFFARNANGLYKHGCRYPWANEKVGTNELITSGNAAKLATAFSRDGTDTSHGVDMLKKLKKLLQDGGKNVLLSSEYFSEWDKTHHETLRSLADEFGYQTKIIAYLRDQADVAVTHYFQAMKRRVDFNDKGFKSFAEKYIFGRPYLYLYFDKFLEMLSDVYGEGNIRCKSIKKSQLIKQNLFVDILDALGIEDPEDFDMEISKVNPTPTQKEMYIRTMMGLFSPSAEFSDSYLKVVGKIHAALSAKDDTNYFVDPAVVETIRSYFIDSNQLVCDKWFGGQRFEDIFDQKHYSEKVEPNYGNMDIDTLTASFAGLFVEYFNRLEKLEKDFSHFSHEMS